MLRIIVNRCAETADTAALMARLCLYSRLTGGFGNVLDAPLTKHRARQVHDVHGFADTAATER